MRLIFYHSSGHWSASSRAFASAARGLAARGTEVTIVCCEGGTAHVGFEATGLQVLTLRVGSSYSRDTLRLRAMFRERGADTVFVHTEREHMVVSAALRLGSRGVVVRRIPTGGTVTPSRSGAMAGRLSRSRFLFTSEADRARAAVGGESFVAPVGVEVSLLADARTASRERLGIKGETQLMVCVIDQRAGSRLTTPMRTLALLAERHPNLRLALVGRDADADDTRMHAAALGVTPLVRFLGERSDAAQICAAADVGWVAADGDEAAFGCLDFMSARVPVIAERSSTVSHFVPDGIAGVLLPPADPSDTAAAVARFLADGETREAMGKAGHTRAMRDFSEKAMIDGFAAAATSAVAETARVDE